MPSNGTIIAGGIVVIGVIFGGAMWYAQQAKYYDTVTDITDVTIGGQTFPVTGYSGTDGTRSSYVAVSRWPTPPPPSPPETRPPAPFP